MADPVDAAIAQLEQNDTADAEAAQNSQAPAQAPAQGAQPAPQGGALHNLYGELHQLFGGKLPQQGDVVEGSKGVQQQVDEATGAKQALEKGIADGSTAKEGY